MIIAGPYLWSADFWNTVISGLMGLFVGCLSVWVTLKTANPKRGIVWRDGGSWGLYGVSNTASIELKYASVPVSEPRSVDLQLENCGRRDTLPSDFTLGDDSLVFDFGTNVVAVLDVNTVPPSAPAPPVEINGAFMKIKQSPLAAGQRVGYRVLLDGPSTIKLATAALRDTPVTKPSQKKATALGIGLVVTLLGIPLLTGIGIAFGINMYTGLLDGPKLERAQHCLDWAREHPGEANKGCDLKTKR